VYTSLATALRALSNGIAMTAVRIRTALKLLDDFRFKLATLSQSLNLWLQ